MQNEVKIIQLLSRAKVHCDADMCDDAVVEIESALALLGEQVENPVIMSRELTNAFFLVEKQTMAAPAEQAARAKRVAATRLVKLKKARNK